MEQIAIFTLSTILLGLTYFLIFLIKKDYSFKKLIINIFFVMAWIFYFKYILKYSIYVLDTEYNLSHLINNPYYRLFLLWVIIIVFPILISFFKSYLYKLYNFYCSPYFYIINFVVILFIIPIFILLIWWIISKILF